MATNRSARSRLDRLLGDVVPDAKEHRANEVHAAMAFIFSDKELWKKCRPMARYKIAKVAEGHATSADRTPWEQDRIDEAVTDALRDDPKYLALLYSAEARAEAIKANPSLASNPHVAISVSPHCRQRPRV